MTDLSSLSDADLQALYNKGAAITVRPVDLSKMSDEDLRAAHAAAIAKEPDLVSDVAKSAGSGLVKGALAIPGLPGDIAEMGKNIGETVGGYLPEIPAPAEDSTLGRLMKFLREESARTAKLPSAQAASGDLPGSYQPLTSAQLQQGVEKVTGPLHGPETTPGKYAQTMAEFAPGALVMGPGQGVKGAVSNLTKLAIVPGATSEAAGEHFEGSWMEPIARLAGALAGGGMASAAGKGAEALANRAAASTAAGEAGGDIGPAAIRKVAANYTADALSPAEVAQRQAELGPEAMMMDMGRQLQGRAEAIASQPGKGQNDILDAVQERVHGRDTFGRVNEAFGQATADRTKDMLDTMMGPSPDIVAYQNHVNGVVDRMAKPLYDKVMGDHPVVNVPEGITNRPAVAEAMKRAVGLAKNYGEELEGPTETKTILAGPGYHIADDVANPAKTSLRYWDYVKKSLDQRIRTMKMGGDDLSSAEKADLGGLQAARSALVNHLDMQTGGAYARARQVAATKPEVKEAIEFGRNALNTKLLPEEMADEMHGMSMPQQAAFKAGMRREVDRIIDTARNDGASARRLLDTNQNREKIAQVFGKGAADAVDRHIAAETKFQQASDKIAGNSRTAVRTQLAKDTEAPSISQAPTANVAGLALAGLRRGREYLGDMALDRTREGIANLLTRRGADIPRLADILTRYNAARAANAGPSMGRQAGSLAAVLAGQAPGNISGFLPGNRAQAFP